MGKAVAGQQAREDGADLRNGYLKPARHQGNQKQNQQEGPQPVEQTGAAFAEIAGRRNQLTCSR